MNNLLPSTAPHRVLFSIARWRVPIGFVLAIIVLGQTSPTWITLAAGGGMACAGEGLRVWAAGHLLKGREVTVSGPYRWCRHPLYLGSGLMGLGFVIACGSVLVAVVVLAYLGVTLLAAILTEEAVLRERFGNEYDRYVDGLTSHSDRRFSVDRAIDNREYRAIFGLVMVVGLLAFRIWMG